MEDGERNAAGFGIRGSAPGGYLRKGKIETQAEALDLMATASCGIKRILAIVFSLSAVCADGREAVTKVPVEVTFTQEDCRLMSVLAEGGRVNMDTMTEIIRQGRTFMIPAGTIIVIETVESAGDRMHIKGSDRTLWIDNESLARLCVWLDE